ncbi:SusC/RagA family TonB-linked outer membrane protein [Gynurincola endophyticus]|uniref:SusC/RagA family TonB-linked outer membrane protein n=1 Tax=Gynurincola endophyticus TaxID=2479004 RepID=UPI000F8DAC9E|nr:SusC/RagA family TonB-linked outer membrane protein [Gynurincola endophyticus]
MKSTALIFISLLLHFVMQAQDVAVTGTVRSAKDSTLLSGVSIVTLETSKGTSSNVEGRFNLIAPVNSTITFSYLGYISQEIRVTNQTNINIYLHPGSGNELTEVVVTTALGIKKQQKTLGYSVQEVNGETMAKTKTTTALGALTGKVAGLNINNTTDFFQSPGISLRGKRPLIVIDGIPDPEADAYKINADDIESISVLKGTAAGALYGALGVNGAILYTTKKGARGKVSVEFNSSTMFQPGYTVIPEVQTIYGGGDQGKYAYVNGSGGGTEGGGWIWGPKLDQRDPSTPSGYYETTQYDSPRDPVTGQLIPTPWVSRGRNNIKHFFRTGLLSTNSVSASIGSDRGSLRMSTNHVFQKGVVPNTSLNNSSFSIGGNYRLTDKLSMDAKLTYNREYSDNYPTVGYGPPNYLYNLILWIGPDVDIRDLENYWMPGQEGLQQRNYNLSWYNNPHFIANELLNGYNKSNSFGQATFDYKVNDNFSIKFRNGFNQHSTLSDLREPKSYVAYSYISRGNYSTTYSNYFDINSDLILNYNKEISDHFKFSVTAGGANTYRRFESMYTSTDGLTIPEFYSIGNSINPLVARSTLQERRTSSLYGMLDVETLGFLYFSFTGRYDKTSTLPVKNNAYFYPSAGVSAVLSDVLNLPTAISFLKLRGSWAQVNTGFINSGNPYAHLTTYQIGTKWNNVPSLRWPNTAIDPNLVPETVMSGEYGAAIGFLNNRILLDVTYFRNKDYNNFEEIPLSEASGATYLLKNSNIYIRKGWEFMLSAYPVRNQNFKWETSINLSRVHTWLNKATDNADGYYKLVKEGQRMDRIFITDSRTPDGQAIYNSNGMQAFEPVAQYFGHRDPDWIYGIQNTFNYKNLSLSFSFDGRLGGLIYSTTNQKMWWGGTAKGTVTADRDEANAGNSTYIGPGVVVTSGSVEYDKYGNILSDTRRFEQNTTPVNYISFMQTTSGNMLNNYHYYSGTYLKMRELVFTYNLPQRWTKGFFNSASLSLIGNNLFILSKIPNVDPDAESDNLQTPSMRSIGFNINLKF